MLIKSITLNNYRLYKGKNTISFAFNEQKNVFLISGENGFGKTTFLHSLLWCLYGRLVSDVEVSLKKEIQNGGYSSLLSNNLNNSLKNELTNIPGETISKIKRGGYDIETANIRDMSEYYVEIVFSEVIIPSIPCATLSIRRSYDYILDKEDVTILITIGAEDAVISGKTVKLDSPAFIENDRTVRFTNAPALDVVSFLLC